MITETQDFDVMQFLAPKDEARLLGPDEEIPAELEAGFDQLGKLDRNWVWVVQSDWKIKGVLLASPCHGSAFVWRICLDPSLSNVAVIRLLRRFLSDIRARGLVGYMTIIDPAKALQARLKHIIVKAGGQSFGNYEMLVSPTPREGL